MELLAHGQNFVGMWGETRGLPDEYVVVVREAARNDDGRQVGASSEC